VYDKKSKQYVPGVIAVGLSPTTYYSTVTGAELNAAQCGRYFTKKNSYRLMFGSGTVSNAERGVCND